MHMARYYFDVRNDGEHVRDERGTDLADSLTVHVDAVRRMLDLAELLARRPAASLRGHRLCVEVRDDDAPVLQASLSWAGDKSLH
jgi:hypothetical protein